MISGYFWVFILAVYQVAIILAPHPEQIRRPWLRVLVRLLGRLSLFRHQAGPRTLHVPLTRQPWWSPLELERLLGQVRLEELRQGPRQPAAPDEGPAPLQRRAPQIIAWLQPAAAAALLLLAACNMTPAERATTMRKVGAAFDLAGCAASTATTVPELVNVFSSGDVPGGIAALLASNPFEKVMCAVSAIATLSSQAGPVVGEGGGAGRDPWAVLYARASVCRATKAREQFCKPPDEAALYLVERARIARDITVPAPAPAAPPATPPVVVPPPAPAAAAPPLPSSALPQPGGGM